MNHGNELAKALKECGVELEYLLGKGNFGQARNLLQFDN
jgi:hypothetical protein